METVFRFLKGYYTFYTMIMVIGSGLVTYLLDYKEMRRNNHQKEAKISKYLGLTYLFGGILLYIIVTFLG